MSIKSKIVRYVFDRGGDVFSKYITGNYPRVLMYHRFSKSELEDDKVSESKFVSQMEYLVKNFELITIDDVLKNEKLNRKKPSVCITVDDGYRDFYDVAFPVLKHYKIPATFYITTDFVDGKVWFWYDRIRWCIESSSRDRVKDLVENSSFAYKYGISSEDQIWSKMVSSLLRMAPLDVEARVSELAEILEVTVPELPPYQYQSVNWEQVREMYDSGIVIGAHTLSHYSLGAMSKVEAIDQIRGSKKRIEQILGRDVTHFCYPNGQLSDIPVDYRSICCELGLKSSVVAFYDRKGVIDPFAIRRHGVGSDFYAFKKSVCGIDRLGALLLNKDSKFSWSGV